MEKKEIEFKILHSNKHRIYLLCGIVCVVVLMVTLIITTSKAKYKTTQSLPLINGTINYELSDLNLIGAYIQEGEEYKQVNEIPLSGYEFNEEKSYCTVNGENINATINFDIETQTLSVVPLTKKGTKCYLYFDEKTSGSEYILASANAPTSHTTDWTGKESYYYTGNPDNWISFAGFYWRIIRINGDGSIRMIYQGVADSPTPDNGNITGSGVLIKEQEYFNIAPEVNNMYIGYMYEENKLHGLKDSSNIKKTLDIWYTDNVVINEYDKFINKNAGFCGDRRITSGTGIGTSTTYYQSYTRINNNNPSLSCEKVDIYTVDEFEYGNGALIQPIGLISADEAMLAGIPHWTDRAKSNYLYVGRTFWTMTPYNSMSDEVNTIVIDSGGYILYYTSLGTSGVRLVINLRSDVEITGQEPLLIHSK